MDAGGDGEELDVAVEMPQFAGDAGDAGAAALLGLVDHPGVGLLPAFVDDAGDLGDFAAEGAFSPAPMPPTKPSE